MCFLMLFWPAFSFAEMQLSNSGTRVIEVSGGFTYYSWKVDIYSDVTKPRCAVSISFRDSDGFEIHNDQGWTSLQVGINHFTAICRNFHFIIPPK